MLLIAMGEVNVPQDIHSGGPTAKDIISIVFIWSWVILVTLLLM